MTGRDLTRMFRRNRPAPSAATATPDTATEPPPPRVRPVPIGRHLDVREQQIEVECSAEQLQAMFDRVAANWKRFGDTEPHWSVLTNPLFLRDSFPAHVEPFFEHGRYDVDRLLAFAGRAGIAPSGFARALDFGCGVGRLNVALAAHAQSVVGVDVSEGHLVEAGKSVEARGVDNAAFVLLDAIDDIETLGTFDLIVSRVVLQHNPPPVMAAIYARLLARLRPNGIAIVQMPTFIRDWRFSVADYLRGENVPMEMNALPQHEIFKIIAEQGCRALEVREDDDLGDGLDGLSHVFAVARC